jgi:alkaline phosphatase
LKKDATNQPGLLEMTIKAIDIVQARSQGKGWFVMSEAASIDKMMHVLGKTDPFDHYRMVL